MKFFVIDYALLNPVEKLPFQLMVGPIQYCINWEVSSTSEQSGFHLRGVGEQGSLPPPPPPPKQLNFPPKLTQFHPPQDIGNNYNYEVRPRDPPQDEIPR